MATSRGLVWTGRQPHVACFGPKGNLTWSEYRGWYRGCLISHQSPWIPWSPALLKFLLKKFSSMRWVKKKLLRKQKCLLFFLSFFSPSSSSFWATRFILLSTSGVYLSGNQYSQVSVFSLLKTIKLQVLNFQINFKMCKILF